MKYVAVAAAVLAIIGIIALAIQVSRANMALHRPFRVPMSRQGRALLVAAFAAVGIFALAGYAVGYLVSSGSPSHRVDVGGICANAGFFLALFACLAVHRLIKDRVPPASDDEIRAFRKYQRSVSWLGPGSVPPDPPADPES